VEYKLQIADLDDFLDERSEFYAPVAPWSACDLSPLLKMEFIPSQHMRIAKFAE
jgi:hypothetical protein